MERERRTAWIVLGAMAAFALVPVLIVMGVLVGASGGDDDAAAPPMQTAAPPTVTTEDPEGPADDRLTVLEASGDARTMVEQHQAMMDQMRVNATPHMLEVMNSDPMWKMMRSGEYVQLLEEHEENLDRMLARGQ